MNNLKGIDILVLHYLNYKTQASNLEQVFWRDRYLVDTKKSIKNLLKNQLIETKEDEASSLSRLTGAQLKEILKENELKVSGNKDVLIKRIIEKADLNTYSNYVKKVELVTEKGMELVNNTQYLIDVHNLFQEYSHPNALYQFALDNPERTDLELICKYIEVTLEVNKEIPKSVHCYSYRKLGDVAVKYNDFELSISYYVKALYSYLTELEIAYFNSEQTKYEQFVDKTEVPNHFIVNLSKLISNDESYLTTINEECKKYKNKKNYIFSVTEIKEIILSYLNNDEDTKDTIFNQAFQRTLSNNNPRVTDYTNYDYYEDNHEDDYEDDEDDYEDDYEDNYEDDSDFDNTDENDFERELHEQKIQPVNLNNKISGCFGCLGWTFIICIILYILSLFMQ
ncbi:MAG: SAP domain-containing protein [Gemella sp.]|nr:SAP domain-containing protein [Gemella sp.]